MSTNLFAALNSSGETKFIDEVDRGSACGCFCPICASPLVAKHGSVNEWHFAHEASQERVECEVGALNMLRRFTAELLRTAAAPPKLPLYSESVLISSRSKICSEKAVASWFAEFRPATLAWDISGMSSRPFLSGQLNTGYPFVADIVINDEQPRLLNSGLNGETARLVFWIKTPTQADFLRRINLERHVLRNGRWLWVSHPDHKNQFAAAKARATQLVNEKENAILAHKQQMEKRAEEEQAKLVEHWAAQAAEKAAALSKIANSTRWAPERKVNSSFSLYKLRDGRGTWVIYTRKDGSFWLIPMPVFDGWDEFFPPTIGVVEDGFEGYRVTSLVAAMSYLASQAAEIRTSSNPGEIEYYAKIVRIA